MSPSSDTWWPVSLIITPNYFDARWRLTLMFAWVHSRCRVVLYILTYIIVSISIWDSGRWTLLASNRGESFKVRRLLIYLAIILSILLLNHYLCGHLTTNSIWSNCLGLLGKHLRDRVSPWGVCLISLCTFSKLFLNECLTLINASLLSLPVVCPYSLISRGLIRLRHSTLIEPCIGLRQGHSFLRTRHKRSRAPISQIRPSSFLTTLGHLHLFFGQQRFGRLSPNEKLPSFVASRSVSTIRPIRSELMIITL